MKLQCACGAKYAFDITPEMAQNPVRFVCPQCGQDSSDFVNELVRREYGVATPPVPVAATPPSAPAAMTPPPPPVPTVSRLRVSVSAPPPAAAASAAALPTVNCNKHHEVQAEGRCVLCLKPICADCDEKFGHFCSLLCKNQAARVQSGKKFEDEKLFWRKTGLYFGAGAALVILALVGWAWYAFFGSVPHPVFATRFEVISHSGGSQLIGKDQLVYLHGGTLGRADLKAKKNLWTLELVTPAMVADQIKKEDDELSKASAEEGSRFGQSMTPARHEKAVRLALEEALSLHVSGQNIWVGKADKLTKYDWETGKVQREIKLQDTYVGEMVQLGDELQVVEGGNVTHVSLTSGESRIEEFRDPHALELASATKTPAVGAANAATGGLPIGGAGGNRGLDPAKVAQQAQNLKLPARIALPALLANAQHEAQLEAALRDDPKRPRSQIGKGFRSDADEFQLVHGTNGFLQFTSKMLEEHFITREAMKAPPKKSALDTEANVAHTAEIVNEQLNEMQRNAGADKVTEDESRYSATVHLPGTSTASDWTGEVIGSPQLFPQKTVNVVAGTKTVVVLDQTNKKLWQTSLTYPLGGGSGGRFGEGPCIEHGDTLYVFDEAVLSAFDLTTGNARWRLPSVGVVGLFFDDEGMVYVNTTTGNPDDIKYARQIDINKSTAAALLKIDPKTGKTLWRTQPGGFVSYLSGKFIYTVQSYDPGDKEDELSDTMDMLQKPAYMHIARINPKNGREMWEYSDARDRCPIALEFHENSIQLVFKKEVQVLKYLSF